MLTGSRPLGFTRPLSTPAIAGPPSSPGKKVCTIAAASVAARPSAYGRPVSRATTTGVPVASSASSSCCWAPGSSSDSASQPSPLVPRPNRPARSPSARTTTSAASASATAAAMPSVSPPSMVVPSADVDLRRPGTRRASPRARSAGRCRAGPRDAARRCARGTSSSRASRTGRRRSGRPRRCARGRRRERQHAVVAQQHDRLLGDLAREGAVRGRVEVDRAAQGLGVVEVRARRAPAAPPTSPRRADRARCFCASTRRSARSITASSSTPVAHRRDERRPEGVHRRQLDVDARGQRGGAASPQVPATPCSIFRKATAK